MIENQPFILNELTLFRRFLIVWISVWSTLNLLTTALIVVFSNSTASVGGSRWTNYIPDIIRTSIATILGVIMILVILKINNSINNKQPAPGTTILGLIGFFYLLINPIIETILRNGGFSYLLALPIIYSLIIPIIIYTFLILNLKNLKKYNESLKQNQYIQTQSNNQPTI